MRLKWRRFWRRLLGRRKWYVFTACQTFIFEGREPPPVIAGETARVGFQ